MGLTSLENSVFLLLFSAAAIHSFFLCILLLVKSRKERGLGWLGVMMVPVGLWLLTYLFYLTGIIKSNPHLFGIFGPILYLIGPLYAFFVVRTTNPSHRFRWYHMLHLVPACYVLSEWWPVFGWTADAKLAAIERMLSAGHPTFFQLLNANRFPLLTLAYVVGSYLYLQRRSLGQASLVRIPWLKRLSAIFAGVLSLFIFLPFLLINLQWMNAALVELLFVMILVMAIHSLGYLVLGKDRVLPEELLTGGAAKYTTSPLSETQISIKQEAIIRYMEAERPWLNPKFSINDLAEATNIPRHHISQILSEGLQQNFYELVCHYRIAEIKRRFEQGEAQRYSILGIAEDCGFGSKSSFNRAFKRATGITPLEWLLTEQKNDVSSERNQPAVK